MSVVIRLNIRGRKHLAFHKVVVADSRAPRDGRHIEILGHYDPLAKPPLPSVVINKERALYWLSVGAQPSEQVASLLKKAGIERPTMQSKPKPKKTLDASARAARKAVNARRAAKKKGVQEASAAAKKKAAPARKKAAAARKAAKKKA